VQESRNRKTTQPSKAIKSHQKPSKAIKSHQKPSKAIKSHQKPTAKAVV